MVILVFGCGGVAVIVALVLHMVLLLIIAIVRAAVCGVIAVASLLSDRYHYSYSKRPYYDA